MDCNFRADGGLARISGRTIVAGRYIMTTWIQGGVVTGMDTTIHIQGGVVTGMGTRGYRTWHVPISFPGSKSVADIGGFGTCTMHMYVHLRLGGLVCLLVTRSPNAGL